jgi:hypothetical protein
MSQLEYIPEIFKNKVAFSLFDALSPGAVRQKEEKIKSLYKSVILDDEASTINREQNKPFTTVIYDMLFPKKRYRDERYSFSDLLIRVFLGETKHILFDVMCDAETLAEEDLTLTTAELEVLAKYFSQISNPFYSIRENFIIGYGENRRKLNIAALFNPFNYIRAIDNLLIHNGLKAIAYAKKVDTDIIEKPSYFAKFGIGFIGVCACFIGAVIRLLRVVPQYIISAPVRPVWSCYKFNKTNLDKEISRLGWVLAVMLTAANILLVGLTVGLGAPLVKLISMQAHKAVEGFATSTVITSVVGDKLINPVTNAINDSVSKAGVTNLLADSCAASVLPATQDVVTAVVARTIAAPTSKPLLHKFLSNTLPAASFVSIFDASNDDFGDYGGEADEFDTGASNKFYSR